MRDLQQRFEFRSPAQFVIGSVLGIDMERGTNTSWNLDAQQHFLAKGFARGAKKPFVMGHVEEWWDEAIAAGHSIKNVLWSAVRAAYYAGVVTMESLDIEEGEAAGMKLLFFAKDQEDFLKIADQISAKSSTSSSTSTPAVIAAGETA